MLYSLVAICWFTCHSLLIHVLSVCSSVYPIPPRNRCGFNANAALTANCDYRAFELSIYLCIYVGRTSHLPNSSWKNHRCTSNAINIPVRNVEFITIQFPIQLYPSDPSRRKASVSHRIATGLSLSYILK